MNEEHTPGPWRMRAGVCRNDHPDTSADVHGRDGQFVADCGCHEQATANARLIAAAPTMLIALRAIKRTCPADADLTREFHGAWGLLEAAIAKAEGR